MASPTLDPLTAWLESRGVDHAEQVAGAVSGVWGSLPAWTAWQGAPPPADGAAGVVPPPHLDVLGALGRGGMGEVWRAYDTRLHRVVALKVLGAGLAHHAEARGRFLREAQATAQLAHPGIIPIYEVGELADGRPFFTMKNVDGATLSGLVAALDRAGDRGPRRRVDPVLRIAEAVAYAHHRGVIHRDLKPDNIMVGAFGEVLVLDWGIARKVTEALDPVVLEEIGGTRVGQITGTPGYMAPEQARGSTVDARSDVWALGALLGFVLTGEHPTVDPDDLAQVSLPALPLDTPEALAELIGRCQAEDPADRPTDAGAVAEALQSWLDGSRARARGLDKVAAADALVPEIEAARAEADRHAVAASRLREAVPVHAPPADKQALWAAEDAAAAARGRAEDATYRRLALLQGALSHAPDLPEALDALAAHHKAAWQAAEGAGDAALVSVHAQALARVDRGQHAAFRAGDGALTLVTDPPGAEATLYRYVEKQRRLVPERVRALGTTPLHAVPLPMGSWLVELRLPGRAVVRYPVHIARQQHWDGAPPGASSPLPVVLPADSALGSDDCYVPAGWFACGESRTTYTTFAPHPRWLGPLVVRRHPVTVREFLAFLDGITQQEGVEAALAFAPRERGQPGAPGAPNVAWAGDHFERVPDADGDLWDLDWPVLQVDWTGARAYSAWLARQTGLPWRLPTEFEWEKAARGVDGRAFSWGDHPEPTYACLRDAVAQRPLPSPVGRFSTDESPYGVRDVVGNVREWCSTPFAPAGSPPLTLGDPDDPKAARVLRGGCWAQSLTAAWLAGRFSLGGDRRGDILGFRVVRAL